MKLVQIDSSVLGTRSTSRELTDAIVRAEGLNISPASREEAMAKAHRQIAELVAASVEKTAAASA